MAGHHDQNPFSHDDDINPFSNHHNVHGVPPSSRLSVLPPEPALAYGHRATTNESLDTNHHNVHGVPPSSRLSVLPPEPALAYGHRATTNESLDTNHHNVHGVPPSSRLSVLPPEPALAYGHRATTNESLDTNHHNVHGVPPSSRLSVLPPEPALAYGHRATTNESLDTPSKLKKKRQELEAKEAELNRREEILRRKEEALATSGAVIEHKNWPSFYPLVHHDIPGDIPVHLQRIQYVAYATLLGVPITLSWNLIMSIAVFTSTSVGPYIFFSIIYFLLGPPGAFYFWYRPLYRAFRSNNGMNFGCFFFNYSYHIVFFTFAAIGPRILFAGFHFAGILNAIGLWNKHKGLAVMSLIGSGLFAFEVVLSIWVMQQVYRQFRNSGQKPSISIAL